MATALLPAIPADAIDSDYALAIESQLPGSFGEIVGDEVSVDVSRVTDLLHVEVRGRTSRGGQAWTWKAVLVRLADGVAAYYVEPTE